MQSIIESPMSWASFIKTVIWLLTIFLLFKGITRWLSLDRFGKTIWGLRLGEYSKSFVRKLLLIYEPVALLIVGTCLFLVDPLGHGPVILLLVVVGYPALKNYINGRILLLSSSLNRATRIQTGLISGDIVKWERLGLFLQTDEGLKHIPYNHLVEHGFTLIAGEQMGHLVEFKVIGKDQDQSSLAKLKAIISSSPYLDATHKPNLQEKSGFVSASLILKNEKYLPDLVQVLDEWGWKCELDL